MSDHDHAFVGSIPELYDTLMGPMIFEPYARDMANRFAGFDGAMLEVAAGTGQVTRLLAEAISPRATIVATDLNAPMLEWAAKVVRAPAVSWREADAQALPFPDRSFDAVVCQFGVMFFPDKVGAFAETHRVLRPGGRYVFSVWDALENNEVTRAVQDALATLLPNGPPSFFARVPFGYHDEAAIRAALAESGFDQAEVETVAVRSHASSAADAAKALCLGTPLRAEIEAQRPDGVDQLVMAVSEALVREFGAGPFDSRAQALVISATA